MHAVRTYTSWLLIPRTKSVCYLIKEHYCHFCLKIPNGNVPTVFKLYLCRWLRVLNSRYLDYWQWFQNKPATAGVPPATWLYVAGYSGHSSLLVTNNLRVVLSLRQHSNFTLNFAAIIHTQKDASVVKKKLKSSAMSWAVCICVLSLSARANLVWACDDSNHLTSCQTLLVFIRPYDYYAGLTCVLHLSILKLK